MELEMLKFW
jgi:hypothetical protein